MTYFINHQLERIQTVRFGGKSLRAPHQNDWDERATLKKRSTEHGEIPNTKDRKPSS
jgi:hypothetical protein